MVGLCAVRLEGKSAGAPACVVVVVVAGVRTASALPVLSVLLLRFHHHLLRRYTHHDQCTAVVAELRVGTVSGGRVFVFVLNYGRGLAVPGWLRPR